jgi:CHAD domain-containing protein
MTTREGRTAGSSITAGPGPDSCRTGLPERPAQGNPCVVPGDDACRQRCWGRALRVAYLIDPAADVSSEVRRIATEQIDRAVDALSDPGDDLVGAVHQFRKRGKKLRGLVRLVRPALGDHYQPANVTFRDAGRHVGGLRDAHALLGTFDRLIAARQEHLCPDGLPAVRRGLAARAGEANERARRSGGEISAALELLDHGRTLTKEWSLDEDGFDALAGGLERTYRRGRKALRQATGRGAPEDFHEYRKRTKDTWYHVRLLCRLAPSVTEPLERRFHDLSDCLGDEHDLTVLGQQLRGQPDCFGGDDEVAAAMVLIDGQRADLQRRAVGLGSRLHAERPGVFVDRIGAYWAAWHRWGEEIPAGDIAAIHGSG